MTENTNIKQKIIDLVLADNYQPLKPRAIAKKLGLSSELIEVRRTIKKLVRSGKLAFGSKHLVIKPKRPAPSRSDRKERGVSKSPQSTQPSQEASSPSKSRNRMKLSACSEKRQPVSDLLLLKILRPPIAPKIFSFPKPKRSTRPI